MELDIELRHAVVDQIDIEIRHEAGGVDGDIVSCQSVLHVFACLQLHDIRIGTTFRGTRKGNDTWSM